MPPVSSLTPQTARQMPQLPFWERSPPKFLRGFRASCLT